MTATINQQESPSWWLVLLQGIAILILGLLLVTSPGITMASLIVFLGIYWLVDGLFSIIRIFLKDSDTHWGWLLARGILGILAGILVLRHPLMATVLVPTTLVFILGIQGIIIGVIGLVQAFQGGGWSAGIMGGLSVLFGIILLANPLVGAFALPLVLGVFGIIGGIMLIVLAFKLK